MCKEPIPRKREGDQGSAEIAESGFSLFTGNKNAKILGARRCLDWSSLNQDEWSCSVLGQRSASSPRWGDSLSLVILGLWDG